MMIELSRQKQKIEGLRPGSRLPLYHQLYERLVDRLRAGEWKPGDRIPPESALTASYGVSRITVRKVLGMLVGEGLLLRQRGRGSFVALPRLEHGMTRIVSFTDDMRQRGFAAGTKIIFAGLLPAPRAIAEALSVPEGEELARIDRLRMADGQPMCLEESFLIHRYLPGILGRDLAHDSLREIKQKQYGIRWSRARQTIQAIAAPAKIARLLAIKTGAPLLSFDRVTFSQDDIPVEYLRIYYRADRYRIHSELLGGDG
jgi:GntR family transcriptional regulator